jgi:hypothetical protein
VTSVAVSEGTVWVRFHGAESVLSAGGAWPPPCTATLAPALLPKPVQTVLPAPTLAPTAAATSSLPEQNRIFEDAIAAERRGDVAAALSGFERVTEGPLAESAAKERMRLLAAGRDARAP